MDKLHSMAAVGLVSFGCGGAMAPPSPPPPGSTIGTAPGPSGSSDFGERGAGEEIVLPNPSSGDAVPWVSTTIKTTCDAARKLEAVLTSSGYSKLSWGTSERGLLVETCLELIDNQCRTLEPTRRCHQVPPHPSSLADGVIYFFVPREYAARVFVFVIADQVHLDSSMPTSKTPEDVLHLSTVAPTGGSYCHPLPQNASLWRFVYQYRYRSDDSELELASPSPEGIIAHLTQGSLLLPLEDITHD
jgi:hypothetical protein